MFDQETRVCTDSHDKSVALRQSCLSVFLTFTSVQHHERYPEPQPKSLNTNSTNTKPIP